MSGDCGDKWKHWRKFNQGFFWSILYFGSTLIVTLIRIIFSFIPSIEQNIYGEAFTIIMEVLLTTSTLIFGFYLANYKVKTENRINNIESYIKDFTKSHKLIKNILHNFTYMELISIYEIRKFIKTIDEYFGLHYFNIFIGNSNLASIHISEKIGNFMVSINKAMKGIEKNLYILLYRFKIDEKELVKIVDTYVKNINKNINLKNNHVIEFGTNFLILLHKIVENKQSIDEAIIYGIELLGNIDVLLLKEEVDKITNKIRIVEKSLLAKANHLRETMKKCESHTSNNKKDNSNFCFKSQNSIKNECINKSW